MSISINYDMLCSGVQNLQTQEPVNRLVIVLVEFYGRGYLYVYDSNGNNCISIINLDRLVKVSVFILCDVYS